jgi:hypothetical protein
LCARVEDAVVVFLVMDGSGYAVAEHAFCEGREGVDWVFAEEGGGRRGVAFGAVMCGGRSELVEFILGWLGELLASITRMRMW